LNPVGDADAATSISSEPKLLPAPAPSIPPTASRGDPPDLPPPPPPPPKCEDGVDPDCDIDEIEQIGGSLSR
jgi:hypothetical protein